MALPFQEPFTGTGALSASWTQVAFGTPTLQRSAGLGDPSAADASHDTLAFVSGESPSADQYAQVVINTGLLSTRRYAQVLVRASGTGNSHTCYVFTTDGASGSGHTQIQEISANETYSVVAAIATTFTSGDVMRLEVNGTGSNNLTAYKNGASVGTGSDATLTTGTFGTGVYDDTADTIRLDDFEGGNLATAKARPFVRRTTRFFRRSA